MKPDTHLTITVNNQPKELFMSAGLIRRLVEIVGDLDDIASIFIQPNIQEICMLEVLVDRDGQGKPLTDLSEASLMAYNLSVDEGDKLAKWIGEHVLDFFTRGAENLNKTMEQQEKMMEKLTQSSNGSEG